MTDWEKALAGGWWDEAKPDYREGTAWRPGSYALVQYLPKEFAPGLTRQGQDALDSALDNLHTYSYVAVDEVIDDMVRLVVFPWPRVTEQGELLFDFDDDARTVSQDLLVLQRLVDARRTELSRSGVLDDVLARRPVRSGDVFAMTRSLLPRDEALVLPRDDAMIFDEGSAEVPTTWVLGRTDERRLGVLDVTWDALDSSTASYWSAIAEPLNPARRPSDRHLQDVATQEAFGVQDLAAQEGFGVDRGDTVS